jgi:hypothetical protein
VACKKRPCDSVTKGLAFRHVISQSFTLMLFLQARSALGAKDVFSVTPAHSVRSVGISDMVGTLLAIPCAALTMG